MEGTDERQIAMSKWPTILVAATLGELGLFLGMWLMFDSARMAAGVLVAGHVVAVLIGVGAWLSYRATSSTVAHLAEHLQAGPAQYAPPAPSVDGQYRLLPPAAQAGMQLLPPGGELERVASSEFVRRDQIERTAVKIYCRLYPHTPPTRDNITAALPDVTSHGFISACMAALKEKGVADSAGQGGAWHWVLREALPTPTQSGATQRRNTGW